MTCRTPRRLLARIGSNGLRFVILAAVLVAGSPVFAQATGEHWVGTWATANVSRRLRCRQPHQRGRRRHNPLRHLRRRLRFCS
jgi:hypothetical protein